MPNSAIKRKLDLIARHVNEAHALLCAEYGDKAYLYFAAEGRVFAMQGQPAFAGRHESASQRQERIHRNQRAVSL